MLIHTGERPLSCEICEEKFTQESSLRRHKLIRTVESPYICQIWDKRLNQASDLRGHKGHHSTQRGEQSEMRHVTQIKCHVYICCECHQLLYYRLNIFKFAIQIC